MVLAPLLGACDLMSGRETTGEYIDDTTITSRVKTSLLQERDIKGGQIHVESMKGEVQLSGFVDSTYEKSRADEIARQTKGVKSVKNSLVVRSPRRR